MNAKRAKTEPTVRLDVTLFSADDCRGCYSIAIFGTERQDTAIQWVPAEPEKQTETVRFNLSGIQFVDSVEEIDGDQWRTLESFELTEDLISRLLNREPVGDAAAALLATL